MVVLLIGVLLVTALPLGMSKVKASPATICVPDDYPMIQAAVDAAFFEIPCKIVTGGLLS